MTFLQLINAVLVRLREDEVTAWNENAYSKLIGRLVNDAKRIVENSWDWSALRTEHQIVTVAGTPDYTVTTYGLDTPLSVYDTTNNRRLIQRSYEYGQYLTHTEATGSGEPASWYFNAAPAGTVITVLPTPDDVYTLQYECIQRTDDFAADATALAIPSLPVITLAHAMAVRERGEDNGTSTAEWFKMAQTVMADAISIDASRFPAEMIFRTV